MQLLASPFFLLVLGLWLFIAACLCINNGVDLQLGCYARLVGIEFWRD